MPGGEGKILKGFDGDVDKFGLYPTLFATWLNWHFRKVTLGDTFGERMAGRLVRSCWPGKGGLKWRQGQGMEREGQF